MQNLERIYLASPFSHDTYSVRLYRYQAASDTAALLIKKGYAVFSPIAYAYPIAERHDLGLDSTFWGEFNYSWLKYWATSLWILCIDGWESSVGVTKEVSWAKDLKRRLVYYNPLYDTIVKEFAPDMTRTTLFTRHYNKES